MKLKKLRKILGCLSLSVTMLMSMPHLVFAAETKAEIAEGQTAKEGAAQEETPAPTEAPAEETEAQTDPSEIPSEVQTDTESNTPEQTEPGTTIPSETQTDSSSEPTSDTQGDTPTEEGNDSDDDKDKDKDKDKDDDLDNTITNPDDKTEQEDHSDANADYTTNIVAGNGVYLERLSGTYGLSFDDEFETVMNEIEADFREWLDRPEEFLAANWQDVLAVYVMRYREANGSTSITMNADSKDKLEKIFFQMNIRSSSSMANKLSAEIDTEKETYALSVDDYAELRKLDSSEVDLLQKYTNSEVKQLCSIVTAATGFVRAQVGEGVSEERIAIVKAACSLVGKVGYFWGGKSYSIGWDSSWGSPVTVTAAGSGSTGTSRGFGLDCSGFVCWSYYNGLDGTDGGIGNHTTTQWNSSEMVDSQNAQPGDMVFYNSPAAGDQNHIGVVIGKNDDGSLVVAHCSSSRNGVVVGEAWSQGFKYVRSPLSLE